MLKTKPTVSAAILCPYYISEIKHEVEQAYYAHYEAIYTGEFTNLGLEIYHLSYDHKQVENIKDRFHGVFYSRSVEFKINTGSIVEIKRLDLPCTMPYPIDHKPVEIELFDQLWEHYDNLMIRFNKQRSGEELKSMKLMVDLLAENNPIDVVLRELRGNDGYVGVAMRNIARRKTIESKG